MSQPYFLRRPQVETRTGKKRSTIYKDIQEGLLPPPVKIGSRAVAWPAHEIEAINRARMAGQSHQAIRALVVEIVEQRKQTAAPLAAS